MTDRTTVTDEEVHEVLALLRELSERPRRTVAGTLFLAALSALWGFCVGLLSGVAL